MENKIIPFVINSNICTSKRDTLSYDTLMETIAGNSGNSYITWSLLKEIGCDIESIRGHEIKSLYTYDFSKAGRDIEIINNECTNVILVLQDQIRIKESYGLRLPFKQLKQFIIQIKKPILVAGLGANSFHGFDSDFHKKLDAELIDFLRFLSEHCVSIGLRGYFTQEVLHNLGIDNTCVIGCPSYYETGSDRVLIKPTYSDVLRVGTSIGVGVFGIGPVYLQDKQEEEIIKALCFDGNLPRNFDQLKLLSNNSYRFFASISQWKENIRNEIDFYVGARVHGSIVAINSGVPAVVMNSDSRSREMCEYMNIPYHPELFGCTDIKKILDECNYEQMNFKYNEKLDLFINFLADNGVTYNPIEHELIDVDVIRKRRKVGMMKMSKAFIGGVIRHPRLIVRVFFSRMMK